MRRKIRLGIRPSLLAIKQAQEIERLLPGLSFEKILIETQGDKDKTTAISAVEGSDFFTRQIEEALLKGSIDAAVHSAKDLEENIPSGLTIAATTKSISPFECLVSKEDKGLRELEFGARIGTSSKKRKEALLNYRKDFQVCDLRGTIQERLQQLDEKKFDALIMAHAALIRLGLEKRIAEVISPQIIQPHPLQGCLAVQVRADDPELISLFSVLNTRLNTRGGSK